MHSAVGFGIGLTVLASALALGGCGLSETTVATGAVTGAATRQAQDAPRQIDKARQDIEAAQKADEAARAAAETRATE
jgi:hypothetical protein